MILFTKVLEEMSMLKVFFINRGVGVYWVSDEQAGLLGFG